MLFMTGVYHVDADLSALSLLEMTNKQHSFISKVNMEVYDVYVFYDTIC
jgi:hypothetical protein